MIDQKKVCHWCGLEFVSNTNCLVLHCSRLCGARHRALRAGKRPAYWRDVQQLDQLVRILRAETPF